MFMFPSSKKLRNNVEVLRSPLYLSGAFQLCLTVLRMFSLGLMVTLEARVSRLMYTKNKNDALETRASHTVTGTPSTLASPTRRCITIV